MLNGKLARRLPVMLLVFYSFQAVAESAETETDAGVPEWELGVGVATYNLPAYRGSDDRTTSVVPFPYVIYRGERFRIDRTIQGILFEGERVKLDISGKASPLVKSKDSDARQGMPDLDPTVEIGPSLEYLISDPDSAKRLSLNLAVRTVASIDFDDFSVSQRGWVMEPSIAFQQPVKGLQFGVQTGLLVATEDYHRYFYDVDGKFASAGRPEFKSDGGYSGAYTTLSLNGRYKRLRWGVFSRYDNLYGVAFDESPLLESKNNFTVGASVAWVLGESERRVAPKSDSPGAVFEIPFFGR